MYTNYYVIGIADINITCINERNRKKKTKQDMCKFNFMENINVSLDIFFSL